jgi:hypothetical protein
VCVCVCVWTPCVKILQIWIEFKEMMSKQKNMIKLKQHEYHKTNIKIRILLSKSSKSN